MISSLILILQILPFLMVITLLMQQKHLLMSLLALEGIMLSMVLLLPIYLVSSSLTMGILSVVLLTLGACEASLGLSLMVLMSRSYGSDLINNLSMNKC